MARLSLLFAALLMVSALSLVTARFQARQLYVEAGRLHDRERQLDTDWRRLQLERAELARNARIDSIAREELGMTPGTPDRTLYMVGTSPSASAGQPASGGKP
ncbi:cell division protein FtsL [Pusillimonas sp. TS35]|uniref:cell division protein FtsL n=1 Tax=Paracandidimonas lactea TaxID=2895524 RepID=UPI00136FB02B|nr:cell division protein FtsL [Paracandidimonas lactea]MYN14953.1 cell division protein FtsL [Pusillimonas sp. TS35]